MQASKFQKLFEDYLRNQKFNQYPRNLFEPFKYMLQLPAKRLRPVLVLIACEMFSVDSRRALPQAFAIELFHNFTLIHDDIMDRAPLRRGKPTVHNKFGETVAILSGDTMLVCAYQYLMQANLILIPQLLNAFNTCAIKVCQGQQLDMNFESVRQVTVKDYMKMIELKTATLIATSLKIGAMIGNGSEKDSENLFQFGKELGLAFQLQDDWLDAFGKSSKSGKLQGGDIIQNKKTFLLLESLRIADQKTRDLLLKNYSSNQSDNKRKVETVLKIFDKLKIEQSALDKIEGHYNKAVTYLKKISAPEKNKEALEQIALLLWRRDR